MKFNRLHGSLICFRNDDYLKHLRDNRDAFENYIQIHFAILTIADVYC
jgi:hypothetical protein